MLEARVLYRSVEDGLPVTARDEEGNMSLDTILEYVLKIRASRHAEGITGDRGGITVQAGGFILHAYFVDVSEMVGDADIRIELFGPSVFDEKSQVYVPQLEDTFGYITLESLKQIISLLDEDKSPWEYARSVVVDTQPLVVWEPYAGRKQRTPLLTDECAMEHTFHNGETKTDVKVRMAGAFQFPFAVIDRQLKHILVCTDFAWWVKDSRFLHGLVENILVLDGIGIPWTVKRIDEGKRKVPVLIMEKVNTDVSMQELFDIYRSHCAKTGYEPLDTTEIHDYRQFVTMLLDERGLHI
jgi:hypothetical protein